MDEAAEVRVVVIEVEVARGPPFEESGEAEAGLETPSSFARVGCGGGKFCQLSLRRAI